jgi:TolB-like protein/DNA-binding winged helix-turn-helix (wHTH) protein
MVHPPPAVLRIGEFRVDSALDEISKDGMTTKLEPRTMRLLVCLAESAGQVLSVEQLLDMVWKDVVVSPDSVYQAVASLRRILGDDPKEPKYIANVMRRGYRLVATVATWTEPEPPPLPAVARSSRPDNRRLALVALACVALLCVSFFAWHEWHGRQRTAASGSSAAQAATTSAPSIAVLPFDESTTEYYDGELAQALAETVRQRLGVSQKMIVKARGSSMVFEGQQVDSKTIGRRLGARYLLQGSVERRKDRLRVTAQLVDAESGDELQSWSVDRQIADIFELQNEIAGQISSAVALQLTGDGQLEPRSRSTNLDAYLKFLDAQALLRRVTVNDSEQAAMVLEQVIKMDPGFALAYAELARARWLAQLLIAPKADRDVILPLAEKALSLDPNLGEAYFIRGVMEGDDHKKEEADFHKAVELAPNFAPGYEMYAIGTDDDFGRTQDAKAMMDRAILIDPMAAEYPVQKALYVLEETHSQALADKLYAQAQALDPDFSRVNQSLAMIKWRKGETAEGIKLIERALRAETKAYYVHDAAVALYLDVGDRQAAQNVAARLPTDTPAINILLSAYDLNFQKAVSREVDWETTSNVAELCYWISLDAAARQGGTIAKTLARLQKEYPAEKVTNGTAPDGAYDAALTVTADLLRAQGDQAALSRVLPPLKALLDKNESRSGWAHSYLKLVSGDPDGALALLAIDSRRQHLPTWWLLDRDPFWADLRNDPRFRDILEFESAQAAQQREILERMRQRGEVPIRSADLTARR